MTDESPSTDLLQAVIDATIAEAEAIGRRMRKRTDDWEPLLVGIDADGELHTMDIPTDWLSSEERKDQLAEQRLPAAIRQLRLEAAALLLSSWTVGLTKSMAPEEIRDAMRVGASKHPAREEILHISAAHADRQRMVMAKIHRMGRQPPRLGSWRSFGDEGTMEGRFVDTLRAGLADAPSPSDWGQ